MTCHDFRRPKTITCACGEVVQVGKRGPVPGRCGACAHKRHQQQCREWKAEHPNGREAPGEKPEEVRDLGPERPLLGMTAEELHDWKCQRAVALYREEGLGLPVIAERLGLAPGVVSRALDAAGVKVTYEKRLPAGLPSP